MSDSSRSNDNSDVDTSGKVVQLPVQTTSNLARKGKAEEAPAQRGRPRKVERMPTPADLEYHAQASEEKAKFIESDPVVLAAQGKLDPVAVMKLLRTEIAREAAALHYQRIENEKYGKDTSQTSTRRIDALLKIANIEMEIKKIGTDAIDLHGERFQKVFALWVEMMRETAAELLTPEQIDLFFNRFSTKMEGWEDRASEVTR